MKNTALLKLARKSSGNATEDHFGRSMLLSMLDVSFYNLCSTDPHERRCRQGRPNSWMIQERSTMASGSLLSQAPLGFIAHFTWIVIQIVFFLILSFMRRPFKNTRWISFLFYIYSIWRCNQVVHSDEIRSKAFTCLFASECGWWNFARNCAKRFLPSLHKNWCWWDVFILPWAIYMMNVLWS